MLVLCVYIVQSWALLAYLNFCSNKKDLFYIFYQVKNLFLFLFKKPTTSQLNLIKNAKLIFCYWKIPQVPSSGLYIYLCDGKVVSVKCANVLRVYTTPFDILIDNIAQRAGWKQLLLSCSILLKGEESRCSVFAQSASADRNTYTEFYVEYVQSLLTLSLSLSLSLYSRLHIRSHADLKTFSFSAHS